MSHDGPPFTSVIEWDLSVIGRRGDNQNFSVTAPASTINNHHIAGTWHGVNSLLIGSGTTNIVGLNNGTNKLTSAASHLSTAVDESYFHMKFDADCPWAVKGVTPRCITPRLHFSDVRVFISNDIFGKGIFSMKWVSMYHNHDKHNISMLIWYVFHFNFIAFQTKYSMHAL